MRRALLRQARRKLGVYALVGGSSVALLGSAGGAPAAIDVIDIGVTLGSESVAYAISDSGHVVGQANGEGPAFIWTEEDGATILPGLGGTFAQGRDVNDNGHVVGLSFVNRDDEHPFVWTPDGGTVDLSGTRGQALAINNSGQIAGWAVEAGTNTVHGFVWSIFGTTPTDLGSSTIAFDINENGHVAGTSAATGVERAFLWTPGGMVDLGTLPGHTSSTAVALNDSDQVIGFSTAGSGNEAVRHIFSWTAGGGMVDLGVAGGSGVPALSNNGRVVGSRVFGTDAHAFSWTPATGAVDLGTLGGNTSKAMDVNEHGQVVGDSQTSGFSGRRAFVWTATEGMTDIGSLGGPGATARVINESGDAAGHSSTATGDEHATLWRLGVAQGPVAPGAPTDVAASAGDGVAAVSWLPASSDGGSAILSYEVTAAPGGATVEVDGTTTSASMSGLSNGTAYTFTVTATNAAGTGPSSTPSSAVTPTSGAPAPAAAVGTASPTSPTTISTGTDPAASGGTAAAVTVPAGTAGGTVSVVVGASAAVPTSSGYSLGTGEIRVTAPTATPTSPLALVFTVREQAGETPDGVLVYRTAAGGAPTVVPDCAASSTNPSSPTYGDSDPDPCVLERASTAIAGTSYVRLTVVSSAASSWNTAAPVPAAAVLDDRGVRPQTVTTAPGGFVRWGWSGKKNHSVTDALRLGPSGAALFDSGLRSSGSFRVEFLAAGTFAHQSFGKNDGLSFGGVVLVPVFVGRAGTTQTVIWSAKSLPGYVFDVQLRSRPTASTTWSAWTTWQTGSTANWGSLTAAPNVVYEFRSRLRNAATGRASGYSPPVQSVS